MFLSSKGFCSVVFLCSPRRTSQRRGLFCPSCALYFLRSAAEGLCFSEAVFFAAVLRRGHCFLHPPFALRPPPRFFSFALRAEDVVEREAFVSVDSAVL